MSDVSSDVRRRSARRLFSWVAGLAGAALLLGLLDMDEVPDDEISPWAAFALGLAAGLVAAALIWAFVLSRPPGTPSRATRAVVLVPFLGAFGIFLGSWVEGATKVAIEAGLGGWLLVALVGLRLDWKRRGLFDPQPGA